jgi:hypothetical protein
MKGRTEMVSKEVVSRWTKESLAMIMIGDALVTLVDPKRHCSLWMKGPQKWQEFVGLFVKHPGITRSLALGELGLGMWLAEKQRPIELPSLTNLENGAGAAS